jgi:hypothetical protein
MMPPGNPRGCMPYLVEILLFLVPFALYLAWRRLDPGFTTADPGLLRLAALGVALALAGAIAYGLLGRREPGAVYVPATLGRDGALHPGHMDPAP